jgi:hypothetical protein
VVQAQYNYTTTNGTVTVTRYTGSGGAVTIPSTINGLPVTSIGDTAFYRCTGLTSVWIPISVTSIPYAMFAYCSSLAGVTIPPSVASIGDYAFLACTSLADVAIPASVMSIGNEAFEYCTGLTSIVMPSSLTTIGYATFYRCSSLTSVAIPASLNSIGSGSFGGCTSLTAITVDAFNPSYVSVDGVMFDISQTTLIQYPSGKAGSDYTIPNGVTRLGAGAFCFCANLTGAYFQGNAPSLGSTVFDNAGNATVYYLPDTSGWGASFDGRPTALWRPRVQTGDTSFGVRTNQFGFNIAWASGQTVVVEACTDLANPIWSPLQTNKLSGDSLYFSDPQWTNYPARFYRVRSP